MSWKWRAERTVIGGSGAALLGQYVYFPSFTVGGVVAGNRLNKWDWANKTWSTGPNMPVTMTGRTVCCATGGQLYILGLVGSTITFLRFDPSSGTYTFLSAPTTLFLGGTGSGPTTPITAMGGKIYKLSGFGPVNSMEVYDPGLGFWSTVGALPYSMSVVSSPAFTTAGSRLYLIGGTSSQTVPGARNMNIFNGTSWIVGAPLPWVVNGASYVSYDGAGSIYYLDGSADLEQPDAFHSFVRNFARYDIAANSWSTSRDDQHKVANPGGGTHIDAAYYGFTPDGHIQLVGGGNFTLAFTTRAEWSPGAFVQPDAVVASAEQWRVGVGGVWRKGTPYVGTGGVWHKGDTYIGIGGAWDAP